MRDDDPVIEALEPVVLLSGNPECHSSLLAYICLPRASGQLISLTHMPSVSTVINNHIAVLIGNLFNVSGNKVSILLLMHYLHSFATQAAAKNKPENFRPRPDQGSNCDL